MGVINYSITARRNLQALDAPAKTYAVAQSRGRMGLAEIAEHMADHTSPFSKGTINGVLTDLVKCSVELLCDGWILDFGELGTMNLLIHSRGVAESVVDEETGQKPVFGPDDILGLKCKFTPGSAMQNLRQKVTLNHVPTIEQAKAIKKEAQDKLVDGTYLKPYNDGQNG